MRRAREGEDELHPRPVPRHRGERGDEQEHGPSEFAGGMSDALPPDVEREVRRLLGKTARRLLAEELDRDPVATPTGGDDGAGAEGPDEVPEFDVVHVPRTRRPRRRESLP